MSKSIEQTAGEYFDSGLYCAESVLLAVLERLDLKSELIPKIATGLCGGMSRTCGVCGAVSGGVLAIGAVFGRSTPEEPPDECYLKVQEFVRSFERGYGSANCLELTGCDLGTEAGQLKFQQENIIGKCRDFTAAAARIAWEVISENHPEYSD